VIAEDDLIVHGQLEVRPLNAPWDIDESETFGGSLRVGDTQERSELGSHHRVDHDSQPKLSGNLEIGTLRSAQDLVIGRIDQVISVSSALQVGPMAAAGRIDTNCTFNAHTLQIGAGYSNDLVIGQDGHDIEVSGVLNVNPILSDVSYITVGRNDGFHQIDANGSIPAKRVQPGRGIPNRVPLSLRKDRQRRLELGSLEPAHRFTDYHGGHAGWP
jgi:hypothetical protein